MGVPDIVNPSTLAHVAGLIYGRGWQSALARDLGVSLRAVCYWAAGRFPVPDRVIAHLEEMIEVRAREIEAARLVLADLDR